MQHICSRLHMQLVKSHMTNITGSITVKLQGQHAFNELCHLTTVTSPFHELELGSVHYITDSVSHAQLSCNRRLTHANACPGINNSYRSLIFSTNRRAVLAPIHRHRCSSCAHQLTCNTCDTHKPRINAMTARTTGTAAFEAAVLV